MVLIIQQTWAGAAALACCCFSRLAFLALGKDCMRSCVIASHDPALHSMLGMAVLLVQAAATHRVLLSLKNSCACWLAPGCKLTTPVLLQGLLLAHEHMHSASFEEMLCEADSASSPPRRAPGASARTLPLTLLQAPSVFVLALVWESPQARSVMPGHMQGAACLSDLRGWVAVCLRS